jgi:G3E family GTPase
MDLRRITPVPPGSSESPCLPGLLRDFIARLQFTPGAARILGWRGVRPFNAHGEGLTCKLRDLPGVFGLVLEEEAQAQGFARGVFGLHYFPHPAESRLDMFPLAALALAESPDYWDRVRNFTASPETASVFRIGELRLAASADGASLCLGLAALTRQRTVALDGIASPGRPDRFVVAPGGAESDVAAYALGLLLFRLLAATVTHGLGGAPSAVRLAVCPGWSYAYRAGGGFARRDDAGVLAVEFDLAYGDEPDRALPPVRDGHVRLRCWRGGGQTPPMPGAPWWSAAELAPQEARGKETAPELIVLTGFLGAGKTTLLTRFIEYCQQRNRFVAVIQNEIGAVGLDGKLLESDYALEEIDEGCVCCTLSGQLRRGLGRILERFRPDVVVLETSGLANPANLLGELTGMDDMLRLGPVLAVVDAAGFETALAGSRVAKEQITAATAVVLGKTDLVTEARAESLRERLRELNPTAMLLQADFGQIPFGLLAETAKTEAGRAAKPPLAPLDAPARPTHARDGYEAVTVRLTRPVAADKLSGALQNAAASVYRIKGLADLDAPDSPYLIQAVNGRIEIAPPPANPGAQRFLVFIGHRDVRKVAARFQADIGLA